jgi:Icc-related predicted phosphoesterase
VLLTHSPPRGVGDREDPPHQGFTCLHDAVHRIRPAMLLHGHIHPHGEKVPDQRLDGTLVVNTVGYRILDIPSGGEGAQ